MCDSQKSFSGLNTEAQDDKRQMKTQSYLQLGIDCIEWALEKVEINKLPMDRVEVVTRIMIKDLEKRKDKAMERTDTDDFWTKIESLQWVLFVIFAIKNERMVVI